MDAASWWRFLKFSKKRAWFQIIFLWTRLIGRKFWRISVNGVEIDLYFDTPYHERVAYNIFALRHEPNIFPWWVDEARNATHDIFDVGGFGGVYGLLAAKANPSITAYIFEPDPVNVRNIERNILKNNVRNCRLQPVAVSNKKGIARFAGDGSSGAHLTEDGNIEVPTVALDDFQLPISLLKIDVEGNELEVLQGARETLKDVPSILIEIGSKTLDSAERVAEVRSLLHEGGFELPADLELGNYTSTDKKDLVFAGR